MPEIIPLVLRGAQVSLPLPCVPVCARSPNPCPLPSQNIAANNYCSQIFFGILILGLSGHLVASQRYGGAPSATNYEVFAGILCLVVALVGLAASFVSAIGGIIMLALDAATCLFLFAGAIVC